MSSFSLSPLASSLTRSVFHSELKTWLFSKFFSSFTTGLITRTLGPSNVFPLLNGCTGKCVRLSRLLAFECTLNTALSFISFISFIRGGGRGICQILRIRVHLDRREVKSTAEVNVKLLNAYGNYRVAYLLFHNCNRVVI